MSGAADLILTNGKVFTLSASMPRASAVAAKDGRFVYVGTDAGVREFAGPGTEQLDLGGRTVIPGLTDSHNHLLYFGRNALVRADLGGCRSIGEILDRLSAQDRNKPREWILGWGFDHEILSERRFPTREELDRFDKPVMITRLCGHACVVNSRAIELAGPERLPASGRETGLLTEDDMDPVWEAMPDPTFEETVEASLIGMNKAKSTGITCVHCLITGQDDLKALRKLHSESRMPVRLVLQPGYHMLDSLLQEGLKTGDGDDMLRYGSIKMFMDGSMGAKTAALSEDYADDPGNRGILLHTPDELTDMVRKVHGNGWQAATHAIGDLAVEMTINAYQTVLSEAGEDNRLRRHRIEHASILRDNLIDRMANLHILAAVQPQFVITDFWTINRVGEDRYRWVYPFKTLIDRNVPTSLGSDCPVENLDAFELIYRAVTRDEWSKQECLSVEETVRLYASGGPYACFRENTQGSIDPGKLADMVVLDHDIFAIPTSEIPECKAEMVIVGGRLS